VETGVQRKRADLPSNWGGWGKIGGGGYEDCWNKQATLNFKGKKGRNWGGGGGAEWFKVGVLNCKVSSTDGTKN